MGAKGARDCHVNGKTFVCTPRLGGLGLRKIVDHADIAFSKLVGVQIHLQRRVVVRPDVNGRLSQKQGSFKKDEEILKK